MTFRLLYLIFVRLCDWLARLPCSDNVKNTEILVLRHQTGLPQMMGTRCDEVFLVAADSSVHRAPSK